MVIEAFCLPPCIMGRQGGTRPHRDTEPISADVLESQIRMGRGRGADSSLGTSLLKNGDAHLSDRNHC
uniref:Uncharacterized protein n=1 Tax=Arundo donax TaxID=35708 RepID=A0A0A9CFA5_ARUDO